MMKQSNKNTKISSTNNILGTGLRFQNVISYPLLFIVLIFILYPILGIIVQSFDHNGYFSVESYVYAFTSPSTSKALGEYLSTIIGVLIGTWVIGGYLVLCIYDSFWHKNTS